MVILLYQEKNCTNILLFSSPDGINYVLNIILFSPSGTDFAQCYLMRYSTIDVGSGTIPHKTTLQENSSLRRRQYQNTVAYFFLLNNIAILVCAPAYCCQINDFFFYFECILRKRIIVTPHPIFLNFVLASTFRFPIISTQTYFLQDFLIPC